MATVSNNYDRAALTSTKGGSAGAIQKGWENGTIKAQFELIEFDGSEASAFAGPPLPDGATVLGTIVTSDTCNTTLAIGDANDADMYHTAIDCNGVAVFYAANVSTYTQGTSGDDYVPLITAGIGYRIGTNDDDSQILVEQAAATSGTVNLGIVYAV